VEDHSFKQIETERLLVRRFHDGDAEALAAYRSAPEIARYQAWDAPYSIRSAEAFIASLHDLAPGTPGQWFQFAIGLVPGGALIGDVALRAGKSEPRQAELGCTFSPASHGQGYATEAFRCVVNYGFGSLAMHRIFSVTDVRNVAAQRVLERLGFRLEGEFRESTWFKGGWASERVYAKLRSESL
jgi:aminoglycoside 6'-N-acetyltransferase